jgi:hypothetical protein
LRFVVISWFKIRKIEIEPMRQLAIVFLAVLLFAMHSLHGQKIGDFVFSKLPQSYQLYPRAENNAAEVPIEGVTLNKDINAISLRITRNGANYRWQKTTISPSVPFATKFFIPAELAQYQVDIYSFKGKDSSLVTSSKNIVAGDAFLVTGQSNAWIGPIDDQVYQGEWLRTFGAVQPPDNFGPYNPADTLWSLATGLARVGPWSAEIAKQLISYEKVPICLINSAAGGSYIDWHLILDGTIKTPIDGGNIMYYKALKSGVLAKVKAIIFRQGEGEVALNETNLWGQKFALLENKYKKYFPSVQQVFVPQLNIYEYKNLYGSQAREEQRKYHSSDPYIKSFATVGTRQFDRLHYGNEGYRQTGLEAARIISNVIHKKNWPTEIYSPNIQRAYFASETERDKLYLEFEDGQNLIATTDTTIIDAKGKSHKLYLADHFFWDKYNDNSLGPYIKSISVVDKRRVLIQFKDQYDGNTIGYLPNYHKKFVTSETEYAFAGPFIRNQMGMRAFSFSSFPITKKDDSVYDFVCLPNPVTQKLSITWPKFVIGHLDVYNMRGDLTFTYKIDGLKIKDIDVSTWAAGNYFVLFTGANGEIFRKRLAVIK